MVHGCFIMERGSRGREESEPGEKKIYIFPSFGMWIFPLPPDGWRGKFQLSFLLLPVIRIRGKVRGEFPIHGKRREGLHGLHFSAWKGKLWGDSGTVRGDYGAGEEKGLQSTVWPTVIVAVSNRVNENANPPAILGRIDEKIVAWKYCFSRSLSSCWNNVKR